MHRVQKSVQPLPLELWSLIAFYAQRSDLSALALISNIHLHATRPVLFRYIKIYRSRGRDGSVSRDYQMLLNILRENGGALSRRVERLKVENPPPSGVSGHQEDSVKSESPLIPLDILSYMSNLRKLIWCNSFLLSRPNFAPYILDFVNVLNTSCPLLNTLDFEQPFFVAQTSMALTGIERLSWSTTADIFDDALYSRTLLSLLESSSTSITQLNLSSSTSDITHQFISLITTSVFPNLITLILGQWKGSYMLQTGLSRSLASFLYKHPTIERLHLRWEPKTSPPPIISWSTPPIINTRGTRSVFDPAKFLPNLHSLNVHSEQVMFFAKQVPTCLRNLTALRLPVPDGDDAYDAFMLEEGAEVVGYLNDLQCALHKIGGLPNLKILHLECDPLRVNLGRFMQYMKEFSSVSPSLERWEGDLPYKTDVTGLTNTFYHFHCLCEIQIVSSFARSKHSVNESKRHETNINAACALSKRCPGLRRFEMFIDPDAANDSKTIRRLWEIAKARQMNVYTNSVVIVDLLGLEASFRAHEEEVGDLKFWGW